MATSPKSPSSPISSLSLKNEIYPPFATLLSPTTSENLSGGLGGGGGLESRMRQQFESSRATNETLAEVMRGDSGVVPSEEVEALVVRYFPFTASNGQLCKSHTDDRCNIYAVMGFRVVFCLCVVGIFHGEVRSPGLASQVH